MVQVIVVNPSQDHLEGSEKIRDSFESKEEIEIPDKSPELPRWMGLSVCVYV